MKIFNHAHLGPCLEVMKITDRHVRTETMIRLSSITALRDVLVHTGMGALPHCEIYYAGAAMVCTVAGTAREVYNAINNFEV